VVKQFDAVCAKSAAGSDVSNAVVDLRKWSNLFKIEAIADMAISQQFVVLKMVMTQSLSIAPKGTRSASGISRVFILIDWPRQQSFGPIPGFQSGDTCYARVRSWIFEVKLATGPGL
jgi:hypothetical protein